MKKTVALILLLLITTLSLASCSMRGSGLRLLLWDSSADRELAYGFTDIISIDYCDNEYLSGEDLADWFVLFEDSKINGIGLWSDGSFFVNLGYFVNVYDKNGEFSHSLHCNPKSGGSIGVRAIDNGLELLLYRESCLVSIDIDGNVNDIIPLSGDEFDEAKMEFDKIQRRLFGQRNLDIYAGEKTATALLPPVFSLPFTNASRFTIVGENMQVLYDDGGIIAFRATLLRFLVFVILTGVILLMVLLKRHTKRI